MMPFKLFKNSQWYFFAIALVATAFFGKEFMQKLMNVGDILSWFCSILFMGIVFAVLYGVLSLHYYFAKK